MKKCSICTEEKPLSEFRKDKSKKEGIRPSCNVCNNINQRKWYVRNKEKAREKARTFYKENSDKIKTNRKASRGRNADKIKTQRKKHYNENKHIYKERSWKNAGIKDMTVEKYNLLLKHQEHKCAICETHQTQLKRVLNVDHNHKTGVVRGLLCDACNRALGYFKDSINVLEKAKTYLECHNK